MTRLFRRALPLVIFCIALCCCAADCPPAQAQYGLTPTPPAHWTFTPSQTNAQVASLTAQVSVLTSQVSVDNAQLAAAAAQAQTDAASLASEQAAVQAAQAQVQQDQAAAASAQAQIVSLTAQIAALTGPASAQAQELSDLTAQVGSLNAEIITLTSQKAAAQTSLTAAQTALAASQASLAQAQAQIAAGTGPSRIVALHSIPAGVPFEIPAYGQLFSGYANPYAWEYPLAVQPPLTAETSAQILHRYQDVKATGADILAVDLLGNLGRMTEPLAYCAQASLKTAPCFDFSGDGETSAQREAEFAAQMTAYSAEATGNPSAAKTPDGRLIVFTYSQAALTTSDWALARTTLAAQTPAVTYFLWGDVSAGYSGTTLTAYITGLLPSVDGAYIFGTQSAESYSTDLGVLVPSALPFGFAMQPGFDRVGSGYIDPLCTQQERSDWQTNIATANQYPAQDTLLQVSTLDDSSEKTWIMPTSSWMTTRLDVNAAEAAIAKHAAWPFSSPRVYVTVPAKVYNQRSAPAEALVINPTNRSEHLTENILNPYGQGVASVRVPVPPLSVTPATILVDPVLLAAQGHSMQASSGLYYATATGTLTDDATGQTVLVTGSAPCFFPNVPAPTSWNGRTRYLSVASNGWMGNLGPQYITRFGNAGSYLYSCFLSKKGGETPSDIEIIKDGDRQWQQFYNVLPQSGPAPGGQTFFSPWALPADDDGDETDYGCRYVREIAQVNGVWSVAYSMPQKITVSTAAASVPAPTPTLAAYGAIGNGTADDTSAIQAALNAAPAGATVTGAAGKTYLISSAGVVGVQVPSGSTVNQNYCLKLPSGVTLDLAGSTLKISPASAPAYLIINAHPSAAGGDHGLGLAHAVLDGSNLAQAGTSMLTFTGCTSATLKNVTIENGTYQGIFCFAVTGCTFDTLTARNFQGEPFEFGTPAGTNNLVYNSTFTSLTAQDIQSFGSFSQPGNSLDASLSGCTIGSIISHNCAGGVKIQWPSANVTIASVLIDAATSGSTLYGTTNSGLKLQGQASPASSPTNVTVSTVVCNNQVGTGLYLDYSSGCTVTTYTGSGNNTSGTGPDVWIGGVNDHLGTVTSTLAGGDGILIRGYAAGYRVDAATVHNPGQVTAAASKQGVSVTGGSGSIGTLSAVDDQATHTMTHGFGDYSTTATLTVASLHVAGATGSATVLDSPGVTVAALN